MKPILFLDVDGVLNDHTFDAIACSCTVDRACVERLNQVIAATDCEIVLSSAWRYLTFGADGMTLKGLAYLLRTHWLHVDGRLVDTTAADPDLPASELSVLGPAIRAKQILDWSEAHSPQSECNWCVLDDLDLPLGKNSWRLVRTDGRRGLSDADAATAIRLLSGDQQE